MVTGISKWKFDFGSALITLVALPLCLYLAKILLKHLKRLGAYAIEGALYWTARGVMHSLSGALTLRRFCRLQMESVSSHLHVPSSDDIKLDIDSAFITLTLENSSAPQNTWTHRDLLKAGNRIRIVGDPGSGKSSLVKRLFRDACKLAILKPTSARLPIVVELKNNRIPGNRSAQLGDWFFSYLRSLTERAKVYKMSECFDSYVEGPGLLILLDGLDEVSTNQYDKIQAAINDFSKRLFQSGHNNIIILTMRTQFHQQVKDTFCETFESVLCVKPFTPSDIFDFLTRWSFKSDPPFHIARIYKELTDRPSLREMCSNPLILSMYVAEDQAAGRTLAPECRTEFYSKVTDELILKRRMFQLGTGLAPKKLREQRQNILGRLAYDHLLDPAQPTNSLSWGEALRIVRAVTKCGKEEAENIWRDLAKETGLITEEKPEQSFRFIHQTFCEFLAAFEAVQGQDKGWSKLISAHSKFRADHTAQAASRLVEVIPFAAGLVPRVQASSAMSDISTIGDRRLQARCFLETKLYEHPSWPSFVTDEGNALLAVSEDTWDSRWLQDLHIFNLVIRDANNCGKHVATKTGEIDLSTFYRELADRQRGNLSRLLTAYAAHDGAAAFRLAEICGLDLSESFPEIVIGNCDQPPFLGLIREQLRNKTQGAPKWAGLLVEAGLRAHVVAKSLHALPAEPWIQIEIRKHIPRNKRWESFLTGNSLYTQLLTFAMNTHAWDVQPLRGMNILRNVRPPGSFGSSTVAYRAAPFLLLFLMSSIIASEFLNPNSPLTSISQSFRANLPFMLMNVFTISLVYLSMFRLIGLRAAYRTLLNIRPIPPRSVTAKPATAAPHAYAIAEQFAERLLTGKLKDSLSKMERLRDTGR